MQQLAPQYDHQQTIQPLASPATWPTHVAGMPVARIPAVPLAPAPQLAATATRVRWGRILLLVAGLALVSFGAWTALHGSSTQQARAAKAASAVDMTAASGADASLPSPDLTKSAAPAKRVVPGAARRARLARARRAAAASAALRADSAAANDATTVAQRGNAGVPHRGTTAGGGAAELPYTGASTWIAALLGLLLLGVGICVHVNAVRIGMTAMLYRRGILLRPVDCARLAQERGLPTARVWLSNVLHRLLEEPAGGGEFVAAR